MALFENDLNDLWVIERETPMPESAWWNTPRWREIHLGGKEAILKKLTECRQGRYRAKPRYDNSIEPIYHHPI